MKNSKLLAVSMATLLSLTLTGCSSTSKGKDNNGTTSVKEIKGEDLNKIEKDDKEKEKYLVIDVRDAKSYKEGHIKHAINIPVEEIDKSIEELRTWREKSVVVYSDDTKKTKEAAGKLVKQGFKDVSNAQNIKDFNYDLVKYTSLTGAKFQDKILAKEDAVFLDARDKKDFDEKHVDGAKNVDSKKLDNLQDILPENKETPIYTYCYSGNRSSVIAQKLIDLGYKNIFNALDGTKEYDYKFEMADCCKEGNKEGHENHDHSNHNNSEQKHEGHSH